MELFGCIDMLNVWGRMYRAAEKFKKRRYPVGVVYTRLTDLVKGRFLLPATYGRALQVYNLELTNQCPCRCKSCPRTYSMSRPIGTMSMNLYHHIIDELSGRQKEIILHNFGDPLLHPEVDTCIRYAKKAGLKVYLSTVGNILNENLCGKLLDAGLDEINFSVDAVSAEQFTDAKGVAGYDTTVRRIRYFVGEKIRRESSIRVTISMVGRITEQDSREFRRQWEIPGVDSVDMKWFHTYDGSVEEVIDRAPENPGMILGRKVSLCRFPWEKMTILWNGDVVPCCLDFNAKYILGNIGQQSLQEISDGAAMQELRTDLHSGLPKNRLCRTCLENKR